MFKRLAVLVALGAIAACATGPTVMASQITEGMSKTSVDALGARTVQTDETPSGTQVVYETDGADGDAMLTTVTFQDGVATDVSSRGKPRAAGNRDRSGDTGGRL